jgi:Reverse transcriptase (RNA-dependent DNA polymerase)
MSKLEILDSLQSISFCMVSHKVLFFGPLLFILYTSPLNSIISKSSVHHHLYADDTQLFISFSSNKFRENVSLLENAIAECSSWMSANLLMLNPSKTEFLLVGLSKQLSKIENSSISMTPTVVLSPSHLLEIWVFYLTLACLYPITFLPSFNLVFFM